MEDPNLSNNFKNDLKKILNNEVSEKINEEQYLNLIDLNRLKNKFKRIGEIGVIFIHINKAGGTSVSSALYGGEQDENGLVRTHGHAKWWFYKAYFGAKKYNKFFKFAIVRNPYDRFVSIFHYLKKGGNNPSDKNFYEQYFDQDTTFEEFVNGTIKDIAVSSGSACTSASLEPSYVLRALGREDELAHSSIRLTIGKYTTEDEVKHAVTLLTNAVAKLRELSPLWDMYKEGIDLKTVKWAAH